MVGAHIRRATVYGRIGVLRSKENPRASSTPSTPQVRPNVMSKNQPMPCLLNATLLGAAESLLALQRRFERFPFFQFFHSVFPVG